jgi:hypothetical protein
MDPGDLLLKELAVLNNKLLRIVQNRHIQLNCARLFFLKINFRCYSRLYSVYQHRLPANSVVYSIFLWKYLIPEFMHHLIFQ